MKDRGFNQNSSIARGRTMFGAELTLDLQVIGERRRDPRNGLDHSPAFDAAKCLGRGDETGLGAQCAVRQRRTFGNLVGRIGGSTESYAG